MPFQMTLMSDLDRKHLAEAALGEVFSAREAIEIFEVTRVTLQSEWASLLNRTTSASDFMEIFWEWNRNSGSEYHKMAGFAIAISSAVREHLLLLNPSFKQVSEAMSYRGWEVPHDVLAEFLILSLTTASSQDEVRELGRQYKALAVFDGKKRLKEAYKNSIKRLSFPTTARCKFAVSGIPLKSLGSNTQ